MQTHKALHVITTAEIAAAAGVAKETIRARARARGIKPLTRIGTSDIWDAEGAKLLLLDIGTGWVAKRRREALEFQVHPKPERRKKAL